METMRREGYEFSVSRPEIIEREIDGKICEPVEDVVAEVPETLSGVVLDKLSGRRGVLKSMNTRDSRTQLTFVVPSRGLFGYRGVFLSDTRGEGLLYRTVRGYEPISAPPPRRQLGALVATDTGQATPYAIFNIQERATLFVPPGENIYKGQIVGENSRVGDMNVNLIKAKKLTNIRAAGKDDNTLITPHRSVTLERALEWLEDDELLEVTPKSIRLRKKIINSDRRKG
jgi:GTP-binding protein